MSTLEFLWSNQNSCSFVFNIFISDHIWKTELGLRKCLKTCNWSTQHLDHSKNTHCIGITIDHTNPNINVYVGKIPDSNSVSLIFTILFSIFTVPYSTAGQSSKILFKLQITFWLVAEVTCSSYDFHWPRMCYYYRRNQLFRSSPRTCSLKQLHIRDVFLPFWPPLTSLL